MSKLNKTRLDNHRKGGIFSCDYGNRRRQRKALHSPIIFNVWRQSYDRRPRAVINAVMEELHHE